MHWHFRSWKYLSNSIRVCTKCGRVEEYWDVGFEDGYAQQFFTVDELVEIEKKFLAEQERKKRIQESVKSKFLKN